MDIATVPLAPCADQLIGQLARATGSAALAKLEGATLLCERAMLAGAVIPGRTSAGGGCHLLDAMDDTIALNLSRPSDRDLLPALFETDELNPNDQEALSARIARAEASSLVMRGRSMGLAMASERETLPSSASACVELIRGTPAISMRSAPRVIDLSALWAGPLAAHLLWLAGADVVKVESRTRPDAMRDADNPFYALLNQGKASVVLDFRDTTDREALRCLLSSADIVIEAARPRALMQLGIDAAQLVRTTPGLVWLTITGHGAQGEAADWVGFGDDCGVAGGLSAALRAATGRSGFVGDAIADPLTGLQAALIAWESWTARRGGRFGFAMSPLVARCITEARERDPLELDICLKAWGAAVGAPFPTVRRRPIGLLPSFGEDTHAYLAQITRC